MAYGSESKSQGTSRRVRRGFTTAGAVVAPVLDTLATVDAPPAPAEDDEFCEVVCGAIKCSGLEGAGDADFKAASDSACGMLRALEAGHCGGLTDVGLRAIALGSPRLEVLDVSGCGGVSGPGLAAVADHCSLL